MQIFEYCPCIESGRNKSTKHTRQLKLMMMSPGYSGYLYVRPCLNHKANYVRAGWKVMTNAEIKILQKQESK